MSSSVARADEGDIRVAVLFRAQSSHRQAASAIQYELQNSQVECVLIELPASRDPAAQRSALKRLGDSKPTILATGGTKATMLALKEFPDTPVVFFLVPNAPDAPFMKDESPASRRIAGITTDIAPDDQIKLLTKLTARTRHIAVLTSPRSRLTAAAIKEAGERRGITVTPIEASKEKFMSAIDALNARDYDAVLMIPDARVYNSVTVQRLLLWGVRQKKPVSAFSPHVVKAGALAGQYCDNKAIGRQAARIIRRIIQGTEVSSIGLEYPEHINYAVNERTADLIGVTLDQGLLTPDTVRFGGKR